jgi:predicted RNase H-like nuclease (RuvC/YqgF family)
MKMEKTKLSNLKENKGFESSVKKLMQVINLEISTLENFLSLLNKEESLLISNDFPALKKVRKEQQENLRLTKDLEEKRKQFTQTLQKEIGSNHSTNLLSPLGELVKISGSTELGKLQMVLLDLHKKVKIQRGKNDNLIKQSINCIDNNKRGWGEGAGIKG